MNRDAIRVDLSKKLKDLRSKNNLSHAALSAALQEKYGISISKQTLINYEKPNACLSMNLDYLCCLADYYSVPFDFLLTPGSTTWIKGDDAQATGRFTKLDNAVLRLFQIDDCLAKALNDACESEEGIANFYLLCSTLVYMDELNASSKMTVSMQKEELIKQCFEYERRCRKVPVVAKAMNLITELERKELASLIEKVKGDHKGEHTED